VNTIINDGPAARPEWAKVPITFTEEDFKLKSANHNDAMVIEVNIAGWVIGKILVDNGSSADILFFKTFERMNLSQHLLHPPEYPLQGFRGKPIKPVGKVSLPVSFGDQDNARTETLTFGEPRGVAVRDGRRALLEARVHEAQVRVVLRSRVLEFAAR
jgi:hypothetical protein